ncbi:MAG: MFS transporter [Sulfolobaceae archaeon]
MKSVFFKEIMDKILRNHNKIIKSKDQKDIYHELKKQFSKRYLAFVALMAYLGWGLVNTDGNLVLVLSSLITNSLNISIQEYSYVVSAGFAASFVLSLFMGPLIDRFGRKLIFQITLLGTAAFSMLQYFIGNFWQWLLIRIAAGAFTGGEWSVGATILTETISKRIRGVMLSIMQSGWVFGYATASAIALLSVALFGQEYGWRVAFLFAFLPAILVLIARRYVQETPRYLHLKAIRDAKKKGDENEVKRLMELYKVDLEKVDYHPYKQLFAKDLRRITIVLAFWNFLTTGVAITTNAFQPIYFTSVKGFSFAEVTTLFTVIGYAGVIGYIINGILNDLIGAKYSIIIFATLQTIGILWLIYVHDLLSLWIAYTLFFFTENGQFAALIRMNTESFPTRVRGTGSAWGAAFWSLGQAVWPLIFAAFIPLLTFDGAWLWIEVVPELIGIAIFGIFMKNIPPRRELEEIAT